MMWLIAEAEASGWDHLLNMLENVLTNPIALLVILGIGAMLVGGICDYRYKQRKVELEASLKMAMIERGMSADEMERVLAAKMDPKAKASAAAIKVTVPFQRADS